MYKKKQAQDPKGMPALQILREAAGLSQSALAKQIPDKTGAKTLTQQAISNWERDRRTRTNNCSNESPLRSSRKNAEGFT